MYYVYKHIGHQKCAGTISGDSDLITVHISKQLSYSGMHFLLQTSTRTFYKDSYLLLTWLQFQQYAMAGQNFELRLLFLKPSYLF